MLRNVTLLALCFLGGALQSTAQTDGYDLRSCVIHGSPNVAGWPITVPLVNVEFKSGTAAHGNTVGVRPIFDRSLMNLRWPDVKPVGWDGYIQYTLWAFVFPNGKCHGAGLHEFWSNRNGAARVWTGAPILTQWSDWVYRNQWGSEMEQYVPRAGDPIGFMLTAGDRRLMDLGDVRERTQLLMVRLAGDGMGEPAVPASPPTSHPEPPPQPIPDPPPPPVSLPPDLSEVYRRIEELRSRVNELAAVVTGNAETVNAFGARVLSLEARPTVRGCQASIMGIRLSCKVTE